MIDHIYVVISTEFEKDRYEYLSKFFTASPVPVTFFEAVFKGRDDHKLLPNKYGNHLSPGQKCITQSFINLFNQIVLNSENTDKTFLVLESDVLFLNNFWSRLDNIINESNLIPEEKWIIFPGNGCNQRAPKETQVTSLLYRVGGTRCAEAMIIPFNTMKEMVNDLNEKFINKPVDHLWNDTFKEKNISSYWIEPSILIQGSGNGTYKSSIND